MPLLDRYIGSVHKWICGLDSKRRSSTQIDPQLSKEALTVVGLAWAEKNKANIGEDSRNKMLACLGEDKVMTILSRLLASMC